MFTIFKNEFIHSSYFLLSFCTRYVFSRQNRLELEFYLQKLLYFNLLKKLTKNVFTRTCIPLMNYVVHTL